MPRPRKQATTADVREWARSENWKDENDNGVADRGRMPSSLIAAFNKANKKNNIEYTNGGRVVGEQSSGTSASVPAPRAESAPRSRSTASSSPKAGDGSQEAGTPSVLNGSSVQGFTEMIAALTAAGANGKGEGKGTPIVLTAQALVFA